MTQQQAHLANRARSDPRLAQHVNAHQLGQGASVDLVTSVGQKRSPCTRPGVVVAGRRPDPHVVRHAVCRRSVGPGPNR